MSLRRYGIVILTIEIIGSTTTIVYGLNHLFYTVDKDIPGKKPLMGPLKTATPYHIRCLVPCYKESLQILQVSYRGCSSAFASQRASCSFCSGPSCTHNHVLYAVSRQAVNKTAPKSWHCARRICRRAACTSRNAKIHAIPEGGSAMS